MCIRDSPKIMPNVDKKPKGVLTIYLSKLPSSFADLLYGHMCQDRWFEFYDESKTKKTSLETKNDPNTFISEFEKRAKASKLLNQVPYLGLYSLLRNLYARLYS